MGGKYSNSDIRRDAYYRTDVPRDNNITLILPREFEINRDAIPIVAVPENQMRDFFAFTGTYVTTFRPYTAFYHVVPSETIHHLEGRESRVGDKSLSIARLVAGSALAELHLRASDQGSDLSALKGISSTLSASLGQALLAGYSLDSIDWIFQQWQAVQRPRDDTMESRGSLTATLAIWSVIFSIFVDSDLHQDPPTRAIARFISVSLENGSIDRRSLFTLFGEFPGTTDFDALLAAPREDRIKIFNDYVISGEHSTDRFSYAFMAGLLLAISGNGSFDYLKSARNLMKIAPAAIIWFGICGALFNETNVLTTSNGIGRRLIRDLSRQGDIFDNPVADINSIEYQILIREKITISDLPKLDSDGINIELIPQVNTYVHHLRGGEVQIGREQTEALFEELREIEFFLDQARKRISAINSSRQPDLFKPAPRPRNRNKY
jgi:hypothetical protein